MTRRRRRSIRRNANEGTGKTTGRIKLTGIAFSVANKRQVNLDGKRIGWLWINRRHGWGGNANSYRFVPSDEGIAKGFADGFEAKTVKRAVLTLDSILFASEQNS